MSLKSRAEQLKADVPAVFRALKDKETPAAAKLFAFLTVAYALSPIDLRRFFINYQLRKTGARVVSCIAAGIDPQKYGKEVLP